RRVTVLHGVVLHLVDVGEERPYRGEELAEPQARAETLLVALDGVPLDAHHEVLRLLHAPGHLVGQAVRVGVQNLTGLPVGLHEAVGHCGRNGVTDVLDDHGASWFTPSQQYNAVLYLYDQSGVKRGPSPGPGPRPGHRCPGACGRPPAPVRARL